MPVLTARAENRRSGPLSARRAHTNAPYKTELLIVCCYSCEFALKTTDQGEASRNDRLRELDATSDATRDAASGSRLFGCISSWIASRNDRVGMTACAALVNRPAASASARPGRTLRRVPRRRWQCRTYMTVAPSLRPAPSLHTVLYMIFLNSRCHSRVLTAATTFVIRLG